MAGGWNEILGPFQSKPFCDSTDLSSGAHLELGCSCLGKEWGQLRKSSSPWNRHHVGGFAITAERKMGKMEKGIANWSAKKRNCIRTSMDKWCNSEILWAFLTASGELVWTQTWKWIRRLAWQDLNFQLFLEVHVLFQALLLAWKEVEIWGGYFICLWFPVKSKQWYQLPWKHVEISWRKVINYNSKIISTIVCGKFPKLNPWVNFFQ